MSIKNNTTSLQEVLDTINALPEAGGGGGTAEWSENEDAIINKTISSYTNNRVVIVGNYAFYECSNLTTASFPVCTSIGAYAFADCASLASVSIPACTIMRIGAFESCSNLTTASFPVCTYIDSRAFRNCFNLTSVNFPICTTIGTSAFCGCSKLTNLTLGASSVCTLKNSGAFTSTPIASGTGYIYVPASLVASYQAATNWSYFSSVIKAIQGSDAG